MTVLEAIQKSTDFLAKRDVESPRLQTELLLAHLLKMPRMNLYLNFERALTPAETDALREAIVRRSKREPLQHIVGSTSFCGYEITVNRHALVPRPETEMLAEEGWKFLAGLCSSHPSPSIPLAVEGRGKAPTNASENIECSSANEALNKISALDFGTGTGCLAIALAAKCPAAKMVAMDISAEALALARENAAQNQVTERIEFLQAGGLEVVKEKQFDLVISNPPYIPTAEIETLQPEVRDFDPRTALDGGLDGLDFYRMLAARAKTHLKASGKIMVEFGDGQAKAICGIFEVENWIVEAVKEDYSQRARILIARR